MIVEHKRSEAGLNKMTIARQSVDRPGFFHHDE
jgi:hypothetical protein